MQHNLVLALAAVTSKIRGVNETQDRSAVT